MALDASKQPAKASGTYRIGGDLQVDRLGYGAMQITGPGVWGDPKDPAEAVRVLRRAIELGVTFIDTADSYGPFVSEMLIKEALHPYAGDLVIATKAGLTRSGPGDWRPVGRPEYLRQQCELSLRHLGLERIELYQLHRIDAKVPEADQLGVLADLVREGKVRCVGLSEVDADAIRRARRIVPIVSVQNRYNLADREWEATLRYCERERIAFIPWAPLDSGRMDQNGGVAGVARRIDASPMQVAIAWLLQRSPVVLPIPGTSTVRHLEENVTAAGVRLRAEDIAALDA